MTEAPAQEFPGITTPMADGSEAVFSTPPDGWQDDMVGLLVLGRLTSTFEWLGHKITLKSLTVSEEMIVGTLVKEWGDTISAAKAYATAMAALSVQDIDGHPMPVPLGDTSGAIGWAIERFKYAQRWYPWTIDVIYGRYLELEQRIGKVMAELGKDLAPGAVIPGLSGTSDLPTVRDSSGESPSPASRKPRSKSSSS